MIAYTPLTLSWSSSASVQATRREQCRTHSTGHVHSQPGRERPPGAEAWTGVRVPEGGRSRPGCGTRAEFRPAKNAGRRSRRLTHSTSFNSLCSQQFAKTSILEHSRRTPPLQAGRSARMGEKRAPGVPRGVPPSAVSWGKNVPWLFFPVFFQPARRCCRHRS